MSLIGTKKYPNNQRRAAERKANGVGGVGTAQWVKEKEGGEEE